MYARVNEAPASRTKASAQPPRADHNAVSAILGQAASRSEKPVRRRRISSGAPRIDDGEAERLRQLREAPTRVQPAVSEAVIEEARARMAKRAPSGGDKKKGKKGFSETQWFMRGVDSDVLDAVDVETGRVEVDESAYERDDSIAETKRRRFSLRSKE